MMIPVPKTKAQELFDRVIEIGASKVAPNIFVLNGIKKDARAELGHDPVTAHQVLGAVASLEFDIPDLQKHHKAAIALSRDVQAIVNYAISLERVGLLDEAYDQSVAASKLCPEDLGLLRRVADLSLFIGKFQESIKLYEKLRIRAPEEQISPNVTAPDDISFALEEMGVSSDEFTRSYRIAFELLRERKVPCEGLQILLSDLPEDRTVTYYISVPVDIEAAIELECELAVKLNNTLQEWHPDKLILSYGSTL